MLEECTEENRGLFTQAEIRTQQKCWLEGLCTCPETSGLNPALLLSFTVLGKSTNAYDPYFLCPEARTVHSPLCSSYEIRIRLCTDTAMPHNFLCLVKRETLDQLNFIKFNFAKNSSQIGTPQKPNKFRETPWLPHSWLVFIVQKKKVLQSRKISVGYSWGVCLI